jgi:hypothetical protein
VFLRRPDPRPRRADGGGKRRGTAVSPGRLSVRSDPDQTILCGGLSVITRGDIIPTEAVVSIGGKVGIRCGGAARIDSRCDILGVRDRVAGDRHAVEGHRSRGRRDGDDRRQRRSVGRVAVAPKIGRKRVVPGRDQRADFETKPSQANYNAVKAL